jgi:hypothetical protein
MSRAVGRSFGRLIAKELVPSGVCNGAIRKVAARDFHPGERVPEAGIYAVVHETKHRGTPELVLLPDSKFPRCRICGDQVRFRLSRTVPPLAEDEDFREGDRAAVLS